MQNMNQQWGISSILSAILTSELGGKQISLCRVILKEELRLDFGTLINIERIVIGRRLTSQRGDWDFGFVYGDWRIERKRQVLFTDVEAKTKYEDIESLLTGKKLNTVRLDECGCLALNLEDDISAICQNAVDSECDLSYSAWFIGRRNHWTISRAVGNYYSIEQLHVPASVTNVKNR